MNQVIDLKFDPFTDAGITNYDQFKRYGFLVYGSIEQVRNRVKKQIKQINNGYFFSERTILIGERGIGKTSTLFYIRDLFRKEGIEANVLSRLPENTQNYMDLVSQSKSTEGSVIVSGRNMVERGLSRFNEHVEKPVYILIDFPDKLDAKNFKNFLGFLWSLMTHRNYSNINMIFAMNHSHFNKSFTYSEVLGKFLTLRLEPLNFEEMQDFLELRLRTLNKKPEDLFDIETLKAIFDCSKGIPRNVISACSVLIDSLNGGKENRCPIPRIVAENLLREEYITQVINDRVDDLELRDIYQKMAQVLREKFRGRALSQEDFVQEVRKQTNLGRNSVLSRINEMIKFGLIRQYRGGMNRVNKIISFR